MEKRVLQIKSLQILKNIITFYRNEKDMNRIGFIIDIQFVIYGADIIEVQWNLGLVNYEEYNHNSDIAFL